MWFELDRSRLCCFCLLCAYHQVHRCLATSLRWFLCACHPASMHEAHSGKQSTRGREKGLGGSRPCRRPSGVTAVWPADQTHRVNGWLAGSPTKSKSNCFENHACCVTLKQDMSLASQPGSSETRGHGRPSHFRVLLCRNLVWSACMA